MGQYVLIAGDFTPWGGMDRANYELAWHLADRVGASVHLVSHRVAPPLATHPRVTWCRVPRPLGRHSLGTPLLAWTGRRVTRAMAPWGARVVVNGGNCAGPDVNWVHYVHAAWDRPAAHAPSSFRFRAAVLGRMARRAERAALRSAALVLANSDRTRRELVDIVGVAPGRVRTVYYGTDPQQFRPPTVHERAAVRRRLGWDETRPVVAFIGGLGYDRRKGIDVAVGAWDALCRDRDWDADLVVAGAGAELDLWRRRVTTAGLGARVSVIGFTTHVPDLLAGADSLVSPTLYEAYGLGVHEALCCGLPAFVTRTAGVAERYPDNLSDLLLGDPPTIEDLAARLRRWRADLAAYRARVAPFGELLRQYTWTDMARDITDLMSVSPVPADGRGRRPGAAGVGA